MLKELQDFGLSENEARVYLAALEIGKATAELLSKQAGVKRPTTYVQIESLTQKGLMSSVEEGKKTYFVPESPEYLKRIWSRKQEELTQKEKGLAQLLPGLQDLFNHAGERPKVRFFEGKGGLATMREEVLKSKSKQLYAIFSFDALEQTFSEKEREDFSQKRSAKNIKLKALYTRRKGKFPKIENPLSEMRFVAPEKLPIKTDMIIFDDNVSLMVLTENIWGVIISGKDISESMRALFDYMWSYSEGN